MDENEKLMKTGKLDDPFEGAEPMNERAREIERSRIRVSTVKEVIKLAADDARAPRSKNSLTTGHHRLDEWTGGFEPGYVWLAGAESNWGKSGWAVAVSDYNLERGKRVMIVSGEDIPKMYGKRLLLLRSRVSAKAMKEKRLTKEEWDRIAEVESRAEPMPYVVYANNQPFERLIPQIETAIKREGIDLVIIDYLQCLQTEKKSRETKDRRHEVNYIARLATDTIKNADVSGLLLSQITVDLKKSGPPGKYAIRESQDLVNAAEVVLIGYTPPETTYIGENPGRDAKGQQLQRKVEFEKGQRYLLLEKNKDGENKKVAKMDWDDHSACFNRVVDPELDRFDQLHDELGCDDWDAA